MEKMPNKLYKYRPFGVNTLRAITEAEAFYAKPSTFNDPLDCDPTIDLDIDREHLERLLYEMLLKHKSEEEAKKEINYLRHMSTEHGDYNLEPKVEAYLMQMLATGIKRDLDADLGNQGVFSLSATWSSGLMWSHYADEHRGICIEYDTRDQQHPRLRRVDYNGPRAIKTSDLYQWKVQGDTRAEERVYKTFFYTKSGEWRYEREWRDVQKDSGVVGVPFRTTAILFGLRCDPSVIKSIVKLLSHYPAIKLWQVLPMHDGFGLRRHQVARDEIEALAIEEPGFLMFRDIVWDNIPVIE